MLEKIYIKKLIFNIFLFTIIIPTIIFSLSNLFNNSKYYIVILIVIILSFYITNTDEKNKHLKSIYNITLSAMFIATAVVGRLIFAMLPQVKPILAIIIISGICMGAKNGFIIGMMSAFISNFFFGQGPWTLWQMLSMGAVGLLAGLIFYNNLIKINNLNVCIFGGLCSLLIYSVINNFGTMVMMNGNINLTLFLTYTLAGINMDIILSVSTVIFLFVLLKPVLKIMKIIKNKHLLEKQKGF